MDSRPLARVGERCSFRPISSIKPVFASIIAFFAINEILNGREYIGAGILFFGVLVSELGDYTYIFLA
jgi:uncharacterized membrane protein